MDERELEAIEKACAEATPRKPIPFDGSTEQMAQWAHETLYPLVNSGHLTEEQILALGMLLGIVFRLTRDKGQP